ncbi:MAG: P-loop NTPase [Rhodoluna sp.]
MMNSLESQVLASVGKVSDPELSKPLTELGMVGAINGSIEKFSVEIKLTVSHCPMKAELESLVKSTLALDFPNSEFHIDLTVMSKEELAKLKVKLRGHERTNPFLQSPTRVILVGSGKGGVGKSTLTANLAVGLAKRGFKVGLIDADIFGFSLTKLMGTSSRPTRLDDMMLPPTAFGVKLMSIGMFLDANEPVSWRGPMLHKAIEQFLSDVYWGDLDFLVIDMPPGTGDVSISIGQLLPNAKYLVVSTPASDASLVAARSAMAAFKSGQEIIGVVENFSWLELPDNSKQYPFGVGGGESLAK